MFIEKLSTTSTEINLSLLGESLFEEIKLHDNAENSFHFHFLGQATSATFLQSNYSRLVGLEIFWTLKIENLKEKVSKINHNARKSLLAMVLVRTSSAATIGRL